MYLKRRVFVMDCACKVFGNLNDNIDQTRSYNKNVMGSTFKINKSTDGNGVSIVSEYRLEKGLGLRL